MQKLLGKKGCQLLVEASKVRRMPEPAWDEWITWWEQEASDAVRPIEQSVSNLLDGDDEFLDALYEKAEKVGLLHSEKAWGLFWDGDQVDFEVEYPEQIQSLRSSAREVLEGPRIPARQRQALQEYKDMLQRRAKFVEQLLAEPR